MHKSCALFIQFESLLSADHWRWPWSSDTMHLAVAIWLYMYLYNYVTIQIYIYEILNGGLGGLWA